MTKRERLIDLLQEMNYSELVLLHNDYCAAIDDFDNQIYVIEQFDEIFEGVAPFDISLRIFYGDFNPNYEYFKFNGYGNIKSICKWEIDRFIESVDIVDYIIEKNFDFDNNDILYILEDIEEDSEQ